MIPLRSFLYIILVCGDPFMPDAGDGTYYYWNTGEQSRSIEVSASGIYIVKIDNDFCSLTDTVNVTYILWEDCHLFLHIPNAFSPNGDGLNDVFGIESNQVFDIQLRVYDKWGACLFTGNSPEDKWDGAHKGIPVMPGVYYYVVTYSYQGADAVLTERKAGSVQVIDD